MTFARDEAVAFVETQDSFGRDLPMEIRATLQHYLVREINVARPALRPAFRSDVASSEYPRALRNSGGVLYFLVLDSTYCPIWHLDIGVFETASSAERLAK